MDAEDSVKLAKNLIGKVINKRYRVDAFIGSQGTGLVYKVWNLQDDTFLLMRIISNANDFDPSAYKEAVREASILSKLSHPNIIPFYGLHKTKAFSFTLEKYFDGNTLDQLLRMQRGGQLPIQDALIIIKVISDALAYTHSTGIVHGDLKPENVMVSKEGKIYLTGFKFSHPIASATTQLGSDTPANNAAIIGENPAPAIDIYAEGLLFFKMLTGEHLTNIPGAENENSRVILADQIRQSQLTVSQPYPRHAISEISADLAGVIQMALEEDPAYRIQSVNAFFFALCNAARVFIHMIPDQLWAEVPITGTATVSYNLLDHLVEMARGNFSSIRLLHTWTTPNITTISDKVRSTFSFIRLPSLHNSPTKPAIFRRAHGFVTSIQLPSIKNPPSNAYILEKVRDIYSSTQLLFSRIAPTTTVISDKVRGTFSSIRLPYSQITEKTTTILRILRGGFSSIRLPSIKITPTNASILGVAICVLLFGGLFFFPGILKSQPTSKVLPGYAYVEDGEVTNQIPGGQAKAFTKGSNISIGPGSLITVGGSVATLLLPGDYRVRIAGDPFTVLELVQQTSNQSTVSVLKLHQGSLFLIASEGSDKNRPVLIETVSGWSTLTGLIMGNRFDSSTQTFAVDCIEGQCTLEAEEIVKLTSGQRSQVDSSGIPVPPSPMNLGLYHEYNLDFIPPDILSQMTSPARAPQDTPTPHPTIQFSPTPIPPTWTPLPTATPTAAPIPYGGAFEWNQLNASTQGIRFSGFHDFITKSGWVSTGIIITLLASGLYKIIFGFIRMRKKRIMSVYPKDTTMQTSISRFSNWKE